MATCYKALAQVEDAEDCYKALLQHDPKDGIDEFERFRSAVRNLVDGGKFHESFGVLGVVLKERLVTIFGVLQIRREQEAAENAPGTPSIPLPSNDESAFLPNQPKGDSRTRRAALTLQEKKDLYNKRTEQALVKWRQLEYLKPAMEAGEPDACTKWIDTAGELVDDFRNTRALYPLERGKEFRGFVQLAGRRAYARSEKEKLERMKARLQESLTDDTEPFESSPDLKIFRGLDFDTWLYIFMQYALCLTLFVKSSYTSDWNW